MELKPIGGHRPLQKLHSGSRFQFLFEIRHTLAKRQMGEDLDKADQVTAAAAAVRTQPDPLLACAGATRLPVVALQILQRRNALCEPLQILDHCVAFTSGVELRRKAGIFPGEDGGRRSF